MHTFHYPGEISLFSLSKQVQDEAIRSLGLIPRQIPIGYRTETIVNEDITIYLIKDVDGIEIATGVVDLPDICIAIISSNIPHSIVNEYGRTNNAFYYQLYHTEKELALKKKR